MDGQVGNNATKRLRNRCRSKRQRESRRKKQQQFVKMTEELTNVKKELKISKITCAKLRNAVARTKSVTLRATATSKGVGPTGTIPERILCKFEGKRDTPLIERYALKDLETTSSANHDEIGKGSFGCCRKRFLSATEVAVKEYDPSFSSRSMVFYEAKVMANICCGHPNLPLFMGVYDFTGGLPYLVSKFYSVGGTPLNLHQLLYKSTIHEITKEEQWVRIASGICAAVESIHNKHFLHNDIKCDNVVMSDLIPSYSNSPPLWPILIDFGKARPFSSPKRYYLRDIEKDTYRRDYPHLAPELVQGECTQNVKTDVYSVGRVLFKIGNVHKLKQLEAISQKCMSVKPELRPTACSLHALLSEIQ